MLKSHMGVVATTLAGTGRTFPSLQKVLLDSPSLHECLPLELQRHDQDESPHRAALFSRPDIQ